MSIHVINSSEEMGSTLRHVPEDLKTADICLEAVTKHGFELAYVPEELRAPDLCLAAVQPDAEVTVKIRIARLN